MTTMLNGLRTNSLIAGCLATALALCGCPATTNNTDSGPNNNNGTDSGTDAGTDAGHDAGPASGAFGGNCINNMTGMLQQSNCQSGLDCFGLSNQNSALNICSKTCSTTSATNDCGMNGTSANICVGGLDACFLGCTVGDNAACGRSDFVCIPWTSATAGICFPDCTQQSASYCADTFIYPFFACDKTAGDPNFGGCTSLGSGATCGGTNPACASGEACYNVPNSSPAEDLCTTSCDAAADAGCSINTDCNSGLCNPGADGGPGTCSSCPPGTTCGATTIGSGDVCNLVPAADYAPCTAPAQCQATNANAYCFDDNMAAASGTTPGHCFTICGTGGGTCTGGEACTALQAGLSLCLQPCGQDGGSACPATTVCTPASSTGTAGFCFPGAAPDGGMGTDAGPADAGPSCTIPDGGVAICNSLSAAQATGATQEAPCDSADAGLLISINSFSFTNAVCCGIEASCSSSSDQTALANLASCISGLPVCDPSNTMTYENAIGACIGGVQSLSSACQAALQ